MITIRVPSDYSTLEDALDYFYSSIRWVDSTEIVVESLINTTRPYQFGKTPVGVTHYLRLSGNNNLKVLKGHKWVFSGNESIQNFQAHNIVFGSNGVVTDNIFVENHNYSLPVFVNCYFYNNKCTLGAFRSDNYPIVFDRCYFTDIDIISKSKFISQFSFFRGCGIVDSEFLSVEGDFINNTFWDCTRISIVNKCLKNDEQRVNLFINNVVWNSRLSTGFAVNVNGPVRCLNNDIDRLQSTGCLHNLDNCHLCNSNISEDPNYDGSQAWGGIRGSPPVFPDGSPIRNSGIYISDIVPLIDYYNQVLNPENIVDIGCWQKSCNVSCEVSCQSSCEVSCEYLCEIGCESSCEDFFEVAHGLEWIISVGKYNVNTDTTINENVSLSDEFEPYLF